MKSLAAAFILISGASFAQTGEIPAENASSTFSLNQATQSLTLQKKDFETLYRTDQVPDTCYRSEVQGTRTECHTEFDRQCHMENRQRCEYRYYPVCQNVPRQVCYPQEVCTTQMDNVCNSHGCTPVPRRVCRTVNQCSTQWQNVCRNEQRYECQNYPEQVCQNIPRQVCNQVPNVVQVPYACTRPVQVPIGQQLKLDTRANVTIQFANFAELGSLPDVFVAQLADGNVIVKPSAPSSAYLFQIIDQKRTEQVISATEKVVNVVITIQATSILKLNQFMKLEISNMKFFDDRVEFNLNGSINVPMKGNLTIARRRTLASPETIVNKDFGANALLIQGNTLVLSYNTLGVTPLESKYYYVTLNLNIDVNTLSRNSLNPEALATLQVKAIENTTSGYPY